MLDVDYDTSTWSVHEIESAYEQDAGLMELVAHFDARPATQEMLLDDFLQGFLQGSFQSFLQGAPPCSHLPQGFLHENLLDPFRESCGAP